MTLAVSQTDCYLEHFERCERRRSAVGGPWFDPQRKAALAHFAELGFPTTRHEDWRFTNLAELAGTTFSLAQRDADVSHADFAPLLFDDAGMSRIVVVNGRFNPELSSIAAPGEGVLLGSLAKAIAENPAVVEPHLGRYADPEREAFTALNTAFVEDGAFVHVARGRIVDKPIHVVYVATAGAEPCVAHPRGLFVVEEDSQVSIVESYVGLGEGRTFTNAVTELVAGPNAVVDHTKYQRERDAAFHIATLQIQQARSSTVTSHSIALGGLLVRNNVNAVLDGEGGECTLNGLYTPVGDQHVDNHLRVEHAKPRCRSWEYYKGVLDDRARGVFTGRILVHKDAQKTDAKQTNKNLLLSEDAQIDTKPQLEIFANDVKCTHGATIGQLDADAIFYLRSRGIPESAARSLLIYAFVNETVGEIKVAPLRAHLESLVLARLPGGCLLKDTE